jgi:hypothetical protein
MDGRMKRPDTPATSKTAAPIDPLKAWRDWFVQNERQWSESLTQILKSEPVARTVGQEINASLYRQQMMTQGMATPLQAMNVPTRDDVVALGERIGQLEDAVARIEALLVRMRSATEPTAKPARTRKPAPKARA